MSAAEEKHNEDATVTADAGDQSGTHGNGDGGGAGGPILLFFILGLAASMVLGWVIFPQLLYSQKQQPFDFSHALHMEEVEEGCESCHYFREDGTFAGVPKLESCLECHEDLLGESDNEAAFYENYVLKEREIPWLIYSRQPDCVFFSHAAHVIKGKMDCVECHGHIGESDHLRPYEENRITGYSRDIWGKNMLGLKRNPWDRMKMDDCAECHIREGVKQTSVQTEKGGCLVCHQ